MSHRNRCDKPHKHRRTDERPYTRTDERPYRHMRGVTSGAQMEVVVYTTRGADAGTARVIEVDTPVHGAGAGGSQ